jgi:hypothetical protein
LTSLPINNSSNDIECTSYPTQDFIDKCNGNSECFVSLKKRQFTFGYEGSSCNFEAKRLIITYECIPTDLNDKQIPKFDICDSKRIDHPLVGFIHSPNYPSSYLSNLFCQLTLSVDRNEIKSLEIYLIDMELETVSKRTSAPTDYLEINNSEKMFGIRVPSIVFNDSTNAVITFRTDTWFNKRGFLLYFKTIRPTVVIDLLEDEEDPYRTSLTTTTTITTTSQYNQIVNSTLTKIFNNETADSKAEYQRIKESKGSSSSIFIDMSVIGIVVLAVIVVILIYVFVMKKNG